MDIVIKDVKFDYRELYGDGILCQTITTGITIKAIITKNNVIFDGDFKFGFGVFNDNSSIEDYKNAIKNLFKGE